MVGYGSLGDAVARGQAGVGGTVADGQIVGFEDLKLELLAGSLAVLAEVVEGQREQLPLPLTLEDLFRRLGRGHLLFQRFEPDISAPLLTGCGSVLVGGEAFNCHAEIGSERGFSRVEAGEEITLDGPGEEALGEIFGIFVVLAELEANESIDRLPIERDHAVQRLVPNL